ncbi:hypothetical protein SVIO_111350 [Streptomyces violaceusniger]|uniref:Uncharacterized protein n=1 Tax=Streptomyces violaceusniger TaxID=68280 RepID=A0A4D4KRD7_STRVO|nr:hypothetical protein SVIO_000890 [Streptomyces violaceusniger]GDY60512.1 hypothetical protein SVIO_111350 [Streptomyces violaceusniger]
MSAEALAGLNAGSGDAWDYAAAAQPRETIGGVVGLVGAEPSRAAASRSTAGADSGYAHDQRKECLAVVDIGAGDAEGER